MPTFKAVVRQHQERKDGKFPVSIRISQNGKSVYQKTGLYISKKQIHSKTFEIKDSFVLERTNTTIRDYEKKLLELSTGDLLGMSADDVRQYVSLDSKSLDFLKFCSDEYEKDRIKNSYINTVISIIKNNMGCSTLPVNQFNSKFIRRFKETIDSIDGLRGKLKNSTKNQYLNFLMRAFNKMKKAYNTDTNRIINHDPMFGIDYYVDNISEDRSMGVEEVRSFFSLELTGAKKKVQDIMKIQFCMCGINLMDLVTMDRSCYDKENNRIVYFRRKTRMKRADGAKSSIRIEPEIQELIEKYFAKSGNKLFDFGWKENDENTDKHASQMCNIHVKNICDENGIRRVTPYFFRHAWATIARNNCGVSKDDIDLCLNHVGNNKMADVYIKEDWSLIDIANRKVLDFVFHNN